MNSCFCIDLYLVPLFFNKIWNILFEKSDPIIVHKITCLLSVRNVINKIPINMMVKKKVSEVSLIFSSFVIGKDSSLYFTIDIQ